jgi:hypothetical protein
VKLDPWYHQLVYLQDFEGPLIGETDPLDLKGRPKAVAAWPADKACAELAKGDSRGDDSGGTDVPFLDGRLRT